MKNHDDPDAKPRPRRFLRVLLLYAVIPYVAVAAALTAFQRKLIYPGQSAPTEHIPAQASDGRLHDVCVATSDGLQLNGWLRLATDHSADSLDDFAEQPEKRRFIIYFPGNAGRRFDRTSECNLFADLQFDVLLCDYRGYADNPGAPSEAMFAADAHSVWRFARDDLKVPADRIYLYGESLGGGVATRLAAEISEAGEPPSALVLSATFSSMTETAARKYPLLPVRLLLLDRYPSSERISSVTCPVLVLHGTLDEVIPIDLGRKLFAAARTRSLSGIDKSFVEVATASHDTIPFDVLRNAVANLSGKIDVSTRTISQE